MDVYFDLPNIRSYSKGTGYNYFQDCNRLLKEHCNLLFSFDKEAILREKKDSRLRIMNLLKTLTTGRRQDNRTEWNIESDAKPLTDEVYNRLSAGGLTSVHMIDDHKASEFASHGCLLIGAEGNEVVTLSNLFIEENTLLKLFPLREMTDWTPISDNISPTTDIIIVDPYLFAHPDVEYALNEYAIIDALCQRVNGKSVNIVFFINNPNKNILFKSIESEVKQRVEKITGELPHVTFVIMPHKTEHDRFILTNYKKFVSGDSFNYFTKPGLNQSKARHFYVHSHGDRSHYKDFIDTLSDLQAIVDIQKTGVNGVIGDKKSHFIKFD